jgi:hypothetical protein
MTLIKVGNREDAILALINTWLKDPTVKCGWCGSTYNPLSMPCCEQPFIGNNITIMQRFYKELKLNRQTRRNEFASTKGKNLRWKLSFPPLLLQFLTNAFRRMYNEELFNEKYTTTWFARKFRRYFAVPERL